MASELSISNGTSRRIRPSCNGFMITLLLQGFIFLRVIIIGSILFVVRYQRGRFGGGEEEVSAE